MIERRELAAVLVTDMVGSTTLRQAIGEARFRRRCRRVDAVTRAAVERAHGRVVKSQGDGVMAIFPAASAALDGGAAILIGLEALNRRAAADEVVAVRLGVSAGEVVWADGEPDGLSLVEATRLESAAEPDTLVCSEAVKLLAGDAVEHQFTELGELKLKGLRTPLTAWRLDLTRRRTDEAVGLPDPLAWNQRLRFVGRQAELGALLERWDRVATEGGHVVRVVGEPGVGKTRLCRELARTVVAESSVVLYGRADQLVGYPFQPFVEALRGHLATTTDGVPAREHARELARIVPELHDRVPGLGKPREADSDTQRHHLFEAMAGWLRSLAEEDPVLLVLDDLMWATEPTVAMVRHVVSALAASPVLCVGAYRQTEQTPFLRQAMADLSRLGLASRVPLGGLREGDVLDALIDLLDERLLDGQVVSLAREVWRRTDGNPFFCGEIFADMIARGSLAADAAGAIPLPEGVEDAVGRRVETVSDDCRHVLEWASVVGANFDPQVVEQAAKLDADTVADAVEEAERVGLVQPSTEISRYGFAHAIVRDAVYRSISADRAAKRHHRVAQAIETLHGSVLDDHLDDLVFHYALGPSVDDARRAIDYAQRAAHRAIERLAHAEAVDLYEQARQLLTRADLAGDLRVRATLLAGLGGAQHRSGVRESRANLLEAARLAASLGDARACAGAVLQTSRGIFSCAGRVDHAYVAALREALALMGDDDLDLRAALLATLSVELSFTGDHTEQDRLSEEALVIARSRRHLGSLVRVMTLRLVTLWRADRVAERLSLAAELERPCRDFGRPQAALNVATMACQAAMEAGDFPKADEHLETIDAIAAELRQPLPLGYARLRQSMRASVAGDLVLSEKLAREAYEFCDAAGQPDAGAFWVGQRFNIRFHQGRLDEIVGEMTEAADEHPGIVAFRTALSMIHTELDQPHEARLALDAVFGPAGTGVPDDLNWLTAMAFAAHGAAAVHDRERCHDLLAALLPYRDQFVDNASTFFGSVERYVGLTASALGQHADAAVAFERAAAAHERLGAPILLARTRLEWAEALIDGGAAPDGPAVRQLVGQALDAANRFSLVTIQRRARSRLDGVVTLGP